MEANSGFIARNFEQLLKKKIPSKVKRMCFIASLTANIRGISVLDHESLKTLNETMSLANNEGSLLIPVKAGKSIWRDSAKDFDAIRNLIKVCDWSKEQVSKICTAIMSIIPKWLWYGDRHAVATDVELLLRHHQTILNM